MSSLLNKWDILWVRQKCNLWWPAVISSAPCEPSKGMWQTRVGEMTMFHCTFLAIDNKTEWVEEVNVKKWEEGLEVDHEKDLMDLKKRHQEAINLGLKISSDPEKEVNEDDLQINDVQNVHLNEELPFKDMKPDVNVVQSADSGVISTVIIGETEFESPKMEVVKALHGTLEDESSMNSRMLFVRGLPVQATEDILAVYFGSFGEVVDVVRKRFADKRGISMSRGHFAKILFKDSSSVKKTIIRKRHKILGQFVTVEKDKKGKWLTPVDYRKRMTSDTDPSSNKEKRKKRKYGIEKRNNNVSCNSIDPPIDQNQSNYGYPHCSGPQQKSTG